jgi:hypothetical protein
MDDKLFRKIAKSAELAKKRWQLSSTPVLKGKRMFSYMAST